MPEQLSQPTDIHTEVRQTGRHLAEAYARTSENHTHHGELEQALGQLGLESEGSGIEIIDTTPEAPEPTPLEAVRAARDAYGLVAERFFNSLQAGDLEAEKSAAQNYNQALEGIDWSQLSTEEVNELLDIALRTNNRQNMVYGFLDRKSETPIKTALAIARDLPVSILQQAYAAPYSSEKPRGIHAVTQSADLTNLREAWHLTHVLNAIYKERGGIDSVSGDEDPIVDALYNKFGVFKVELLSFPESAPKNGSPEEIDDFNRETEMRIFNIFRTTGLSEQFASNFISSAWGRLRYEKGVPLVTYNVYETTQALRSIHEITQRLGRDSVQKLHDQLGVVNLDLYSEHELGTMIHLMEQEPYTIERMKNDNLTVVFRDGKGDYNKAFSDIGATYHREDGDTLVFEVSKPSDFYRRMIMLRDLGIKPSTLVIGAHGTPGTMHFGNWFDNGFTINSSQDNEQNPLDVSLNDAALGRLISHEFMKPNKSNSLRDPIRNKIQVIIDSCSGDVASDSSVSIAESVMRGIAKPGVAVYGAEGVEGAKRTEQGVRFNSFDKDGTTYVGDNITNKLEMTRFAGFRRSRSIDHIPIQAQEKRAA